MDKQDLVPMMLRAQHGEITEYHIYLRLAERVSQEHNRGVLQRIAADEMRHYNILKKRTQRDVAPNKARIFWYTLLAHIFGVAFTLRYMERGEQHAQKLYGQDPSFGALLIDEQKHEKELLGLLKDQRVEYAGNIVLGLNDALVELTGALAGLSFALNDGRLVAITGGITGCAASLSMAASAYLSAREENPHSHQPLTRAMYTGVAYIATVCLLILPFILLSDRTLTATIIMLCTTVTIIALYTFYITTAKGIRFLPRFLEMAIISIGVAAISFCIGWIVKTYIGIEA